MFLAYFFFLPKIHSAWQPLRQGGFWFIEFNARVPCVCSCGDKHGAKLTSVLGAWQPSSGYLSAPISI